MPRSPISMRLSGRVGETTILRKLNQFGRGSRRGPKRNAGFAQGPIDDGKTPRGSRTGQARDECGGNSKKAAAADAGRIHGAIRPA